MQPKALRINRTTVCLALAVAFPATAVAQSPALTEPAKADQDVELLVNRLMLTLPLEAEQEAILEAAELERPKLLERHPTHSNDIASAFSDLELCLRTGTDVDVRNAIERGLFELEPHELKALVALYEGDSFKRLAEMMDKPNPSPDAWLKVAEIVARPEVKKFSRVVMTAGLEQGLSGNELTDDRDCKAEHAARIMALGQSNTPQSIDDVGPNPTGLSERWGFVLSPIHLSTEGPDGSLQIWHSRTGRATYLSREACLKAAQEGLDYLGGEAWNFEVKCTSPFSTSAPIATAQIEDIVAGELEQ